MEYLYYNAQLHVVAWNYAELFKAAYIHVKKIAASAELRESTSNQMRPLTEEETKTVFEKLSKFIGESLSALLQRSDQQYCLRLHRCRVFYAPEATMKRAANVQRKQLLSFGTCLGKFTKSNKFHLHVTALDFLAPYAKHKIWVKPSAEQQFLYGHHVTKAGLGRITDATPQYAGVVVYSMTDTPLGFGVAAKSTLQCRKADPMALICLHQADIGEYIRSEATLFG